MHYNYALLYLIISGYYLKKKTAASMIRLFGIFPDAVIGLIPTVENTSYILGQYTIRLTKAD